MLFEIELDEDGVSTPETLEEELRRRFCSLALLTFRLATLMLAGEAGDGISVILDATGR